MTKRLFIAITLFGVSVAFGQSEEKAIRSMVDRQTAAATRGDVAAYMATIDPKSPSYASTEKSMTALFQAYKLKFKVESFKILALKGASAVVQVTTVTKKVSGPAFRDNRVKQQSTLIKRAGKWLMAGSKFNGIEYFN